MKCTQVVLALQCIQSHSEIPEPREESIQYNWENSLSLTVTFIGCNAYVRCFTRYIYVLTIFCLFFIVTLQKFLQALFYRKTLFNTFLIASESILHLRYPENAVFVRKSIQLLYRPCNLCIPISLILEVADYSLGGSSSIQ